MSDAFSSLSMRERLMLVFAFIVVLLMLAYLYLWEPKMLQLKNLREQQLPQSEQTLHWVQQALENAKNQPINKREAVIEGPLLTVIEQTAEKANVRQSIRRMQPDQKKAVKIWIKEVEFDHWLEWVNLLKQQNVVVERAGIAKKSSGKVDIRLTLARN
ncbi:MAG: type II secretion system protein GspM [Arenicellales bacterium]